MKNNQYLIIDTSTKTGSVCIYANGEIQRVHIWGSKNNHTAELLPAIKMLMDLESTRISEFIGIVVSIGPGGFSAIRTGIAVGQGLAMGASLPIVGVNSLETSAYSLRHINKQICSLIPAGRENIAWCTYAMDSSGWRIITEEKITKISEFVKSQSSIENTCFCGEGLTPDIVELLEAHYKIELLRVEDSPVLARLKGAIEIGINLLSSQENLTNNIEPKYLRPPSIT